MFSLGFFALLLLLLLKRSFHSFCFVRCVYQRFASNSPVQMCQLRRGKALCIPISIVRRWWHSVLLRFFGALPPLPLSILFFVVVASFQCLLSLISRHCLGWRLWLSRHTSISIRIICLFVCLFKFSRRNGLLLHFCRHFCRFSHIVTTLASFFILVAIAAGEAAATRAVVWCSSLKLCFQMIFQMCFLLLLPKKHIKNADINRNQ